jgi:AcrR family transcriptional regulator
VAASTPAWQRRAVDRSVGTARSRALDRSARFLAVAVELMNERASIDFTVQELVDQTGLSLRAFYQHFASKDDLLLALYEEQMTHFTARVKAEVGEDGDPAAKLERLIRALLSRVRRSPAIGIRALTEFHLKLAVSDPASFERASAPQIELFLPVIEEGVASGSFRADLDPHSMAILINTTLAAIVEMGIFSIEHAGEPLTDDHVVSWCSAALLAQP